MIKVLKLPFDWIYQVIGFYTLPVRAELCELSDMWIECDYFAVPFDPWDDQCIQEWNYRYTYQALIQNWYGKWKRDSKFMGRHYSLSVYREMAATGLTTIVDCYKMFITVNKQDNEHVNN